MYHKTVKHNQVAKIKGFKNISLLQRIELFPVKIKR